MQPKRRKPTHPGEVLSEEFLKEQNITPADFAKKLGKGWTEAKVNAVIKGDEPVTDKMAEEFSSFFDTTPRFWQHLQEACTHYETTMKQNEKGSLKPWKKAQ